MDKTKILLLSNIENNSMEAECLLRGGGYSVTHCTRVEDALNLNSIYLQTENRFALMIADINPLWQTLLEGSYEDGFIERLLLIQHNFSCCELYCLDGELGRLCLSSALLACVVQLIKTTPDYNRFNPHIINNAVTAYRGVGPQG